MMIVVKNTKKIEKIELSYNGEDIDDKELVWGLNYTEFIAPIVLMMQHQQKKIDDLENQVQELKDLVLKLTKNI